MQKIAMVFLIASISLNLSCQKTVIDDRPNYIIMNDIFWVEDRFIYCGQRQYWQLYSINNMFRIVTADLPEKYRKEGTIIKADWYMYQPYESVDFANCGYDDQPNHAGIKHIY